MTHVIRAENTDREKPIDEIFVVSNVPKLDDEHDILRKQQELFEKSLEFDRRNLTTLHHYDSLDLIEQKIFTAERPKSELANQYSHLTNQIVSRNVEDLDGALMYLDTIFERPENGKRRPIDDTEVDVRLNRINDTHSNNGKVLYKLSRARLLQGMLDEAARLVSQALEKKYVTVNVHATRVHIFNFLGRLDETKDSMLQVIKSENAKPNQLVTSLRGMIDVDRNSIPPPAEMKAFDSWGFNEIIMLTRGLSSRKEYIELAALLVDLAREKIRGKDDSNAQGKAIITYIGARRFEDAVTFAQTVEAKEGYNRQSHLFNHAIAGWGTTGQVDQSLFEEVVSMHEESPCHFGANYDQCMAIAYGTLKHRNKALKHIRLAEEQNHAMGGDFSGWRYLSCSEKEFQEDMDDMRHCLKKGAKFMPLILRK